MNRTAFYAMTTGMPNDKTGRVVLCEENVPGYRPFTKYDDGCYQGTVQELVDRLNKGWKDLSPEEAMKIVDTTFRD